MIRVWGHSYHGTMLSRLVKKGPPEQELKKGMRRKRGEKELKKGAGWSLGWAPPPGVAKHHAGRADPDPQAGRASFYPRRVVARLGPPSVAKHHAGRADPDPQATSEERRRATSGKRQATSDERRAASEEGGGRREGGGREERRRKEEGGAATALFKTRTQP